GTSPPGPAGPPPAGTDLPGDTRPGGLVRDERVALTLLAALFAITVVWWALALWPVPEAAPYWLLRTRAVCFGAQGNGLPDLAGWVGLTGQPLGLLGVLLFGWRGPLASGLRRLGRTRGGLRLRRAGALALTVSVLAAGHRVGTGVTALQAATPEVTLPEHPRLDEPAPPLQLLSHEGQPLSLARLEGRPVLVTFAFAHCADICPLLVSDALRAQARLAAAPPERRPALLVVTMDPWRDTPARLPHIAEAWGLGADAWLLGGEPAAVEAALDAWRVGRQRDGRTGDVAHARLTYVVDARGRLAYATSGGADTLVSLLDAL
ncbi:MAG TPA: SCO family protein, partial [Longimicrobiales bacterium]|nr:SCO family protein [Longimicrobiales bacterium]